MGQGMWGADVGALRQLAGDMSSAADRIRSIGSSTATAVHANCWNGPDQQRFVGDWDSSLHPQLVAIAQTLSVSAESVRRNADEQESASAGGTGTGPGAGPGTGPGGWPGGGPGTGPGNGPGTGPDSGPGSGDDSWLGVLPGWVGDVANIAGMVSDFVGSGLEGAELLKLLKLPGAVSGAFTGLGVGFGLLGAFEGGFEMGQGIVDGNGWAIGDGAITATIGGAGAIAAVALASNPVGWAIGAGIAVVGAGWWGLQQLTPEGMETTEWLASMGESAVASVSTAVGDAVDAGREVVDDVVDGAAEFVDDVTAPLRDLFSFG
ncbi:hypothetical protein V5D56_02065 [Cellulosimicrobium sp. PMB13]|uniref:WXG100 family type VII secretion target n=1 Tax=Cellulosimicrobium sp. PMB13 TaxID=3120158 RepID=UPI003F4BDAB5